MAHPEQQLISHVLRHGNLKAALEWGIYEEDFLTDEGRHMFNHMLGFMKERSNNGAVMGLRSAEVQYPNFVACDDESMTLESLCMEVRRNRLRIEGKQVVAHFTRLLDGDDPLEAFENVVTAGKQLISLGYSKTTDLTFKSALQKLKQKYIMKRDGMDLSIARFPWKAFDEATDGINDEDYIVFYGRPKSMKSWVLAFLIAYSYNQGLKPLIYTKEMHPENIFMRVAACIAELPYQEFRKGTLEGHEEAAFFSLIELVDDMHSWQDMICLSGNDAPGGRDTVEWLQSKVEKHKPDLIFIDGMYLMTNSRGAKNQADHARVRDISRDLRQMQLATKIPLICTLQANRKAAGHDKAELDEVAFSDAIGQDATLIVRVINEKNAPTIALVVGGSREFAFPGCRIMGVPATDFSYYGEMTEKEVNAAKDRDTSEGSDAGSTVKAERRPVNAQVDRKDADRRRREHERLMRRQLKNVSDLK